MSNGVESKQRLFVFILNKRYAKNNCYISQILESLTFYFDVKLLELHKLKYYDLRSSPFPVLCLLQMRLLLSNIDEIARFYGSKEILVYDQDPWESFIDEGSIKNAYRIVYDQLNVSCFLNTSLWWTNFINDKNFPSRFIQMGVLPRLCTVGNDWNTRSNRIFFQGTLHPYRYAFFNKLEKLGLPLFLDKSVRYQKFLKNLRSERFFVHIGAEWLIDETITQSNCCWIKDIEAASQGCFSIRNIDDEYRSSNIKDLSMVFPYDDLHEIPEIINRINVMPDAERDQLIKNDFNLIKTTFNWNTLSETIVIFHQNNT